MNLIISFSARTGGNCGDIARYIAKPEDRVVHFSSLHASGCTGCEYECFRGECVRRADGVYELYASMAAYERVVLIVPMYGGNPSSLYFAFCERGQDFFRSEKAWADAVSRLYIIGVYGSAEASPDFIACLEKWFAGMEHTDRVLALERHVYGQTMSDRLLDVADVRKKIDKFMQ